MEKLKKWDMNLNIIIGSFMGIFISHSLHRYFDYKKYHDLYEMQSDPWYTTILIYGLAVAVVIFIAIILKILIKNKVKKYDL